MALSRILKRLIAAEKPPAAVIGEAPDDLRPRGLNVGGNNKTIPIPAYYAGWSHLLLDIDPRGESDALAFKNEPMANQRALLGLPAMGP